MYKYILLVLFCYLYQHVNSTCNKVELTYKHAPGSSAFACSTHSGPALVEYKFTAKTLDAPYTISLGTYPKDSCLNTSQLFTVQETLESTTDLTELTFTVNVTQGFQPGMYAVCSDRTANCTLNIHGNECTSSSTILKSSSILMISSLILGLMSFIIF